MQPWQVLLEVFFSFLAGLGLDCSPLFSPPFLILLGYKYCSMAAKYRSSHSSREDKNHNRSNYTGLVKCFSLKACQPPHPHCFNLKCPVRNLSSQHSVRTYCSLSPLLLCALAGFHHSSPPNEDHWKWP